MIPLVLSVAPLQQGGSRQSVPSDSKEKHLSRREGLRVHVIDMNIFLETSDTSILHLQKMTVNLLRFVKLNRLSLSDVVNMFLKPLKD